MLTTLAVGNYRSIRHLVVPLSRLNVVSGANGAGKSNLYRALRLLAATAQGGVIASLAREGGLASTLWAGPERISRAMVDADVPVQGTVRRHAVSLRLGFATDTLGYTSDLGMPTPVPGTMFGSDPELKRETIWHGDSPRPAATLANRRGALVEVRDDAGKWRAMPQPIRPFDSMLTEYGDRRSAPEIIAVRDTIRSWRFYDHFRTDAAAPARQLHVGTHTPVLAEDGADLAAALQTIREIGDAQALDDCIEDAFPGSRFEIAGRDGRFELLLRQPGMLRPLSASELSDGTLRYLLLAAALLTARPPALMVLNEPETSLHADLLPALGRLIGSAARQTQIIVVSHAARLIAALEREDECESIVLEKVLGQTQVAGVRDIDAPVWHWPAR